MKTFEDLKFMPHKRFPDLWERAKAEFGNGWGISVLHALKDAVYPERPYEIAVIGKDGLRDEPVPNLDPDAVTEIMQGVQSKP